MKDYAGEYRREVSVLMSAVEEHVPQDMLAAHAGTPRELLLARMARRLSDQRALSEPAAAWAVNSWALALGLITEDELKALEGRSATRPEADAGHGVDAERGTEELAGTVPGKGSSTAPAGAASVVVSATGGGDYASITEALKAVAPGARVLVRPGLYEESLVFDKPVELVGDGPREEIIIRSDGASCLRASADGARVAGLTLRGEARGGEAFYAVDVPRGDLLLEDCDVSSDTLSCVAVHGAAAAPLIRRCRIHDGADSGLYFFDDAEGTVEDCEVFGHANVGVAVTGRAGPVVRRSQIYGGANAGLVAWQEGTALVEECEIYGNRLAGLGVSEGAKLTAHACRIHGGENSGVFAHHEGEAVLEGCELYGHREAQASVTTRAKLFLNGCRVYQGRDSGVFILEGGQALLQSCAVSGNAGAGVSVGAGSVLAVLASQIKDNARFAIEVAAGATARVEDTDLTGNGLGPWDVGRGATVESERNHDWDERCTRNDER
ncbi:MAG TPA: right-handed parallel beta-helix repeat-containing protein [Pyrinomonadaceae bacterium]|nr:right-handed parallel beta-helix repeat-containing protein [Pyrinomonadaceae bacterium]